jgi:IS1 family transposase
VLQLLVEGMSVRAAMRVTGVNRNTILSLLVHVGDSCELMLEDRIHKVPVADVQVDEVWGFVFCKEKQREKKYTDQDGVGDAYTFVGIERTTKMVLAWYLGRRDSASTFEFAERLANATSGQFQITSDGFKPYQVAVPGFLPGTDFGVLVKQYATKDDHKYSPGEVNGVVKTRCCGNPDPARICTSHVERNNLNIRMQTRRMTRLTNGFSKKWDNHRASLAIWFAYYNYCRPHQTLTKEAGIKTTPAMAAGLENEPWTLRELVERSTLG